MRAPKILIIFGMSRHNFNYLVRRFRREDLEWRNFSLLCLAQFNFWLMKTQKCYDNLLITLK